MIDGHNDLAWAMRQLCNYDLDRYDLGGSVPELHTDIPRLRAGGVTGQFWSVYVPSTMTDGEAVRATLEQVDFIRRLVARYPDDLALATTVDEVAQARREGRIASLMGMEGGHSIGGSLAVLRVMYHLGVRYMTLTHNDNVAWADSATDVPVLGGLSTFGEEVVGEMNRLGMLVDLSHVSTDVMRQALAVTSRPVIFSHSSARAVCDVPRNVPDDVLRDMARNGGVCMVTFVPDFVSPAVAEWIEETRQLMAADGFDAGNSKELDRRLLLRAAAGGAPVATIDDVADHMDHVREVAGIDHVGVGGDYDGTAWMPSGLDDVSGYQRLFAVLAERHWSPDDLDRLSQANVVRALGDAEVGRRS